MINHHHATNKKTTKAATRTSVKQEENDIKSTWDVKEGDMQKEFRQNLYQITQHSHKV